MTILLCAYFFFAGVTSEWHSSKVEKDPNAWFSSLVMGLFWPVFTLWIICRGVK